MTSSNLSPLENLRDELSRVGIRMMCDHEQNIVTFVYSSCEGKEMFIRSIMAHMSTVLWHCYSESESVEAYAHSILLRTLFQE